MLNYNTTKFSQKRKNIHTKYKIILNSFKINKRKNKCIKLKNKARFYSLNKSR